MTPSEKAEKRSSVPKGPIDFVGFMRGVNPPPPSGPGFSAASSLRERLFLYTVRKNALSLQL